MGCPPGDLSRGISVEMRMPLNPRFEKIREKIMELIKYIQEKEFEGYDPNELMEIRKNIFSITKERDVEEASKKIDEIIEKLKKKKK